MGVWSNLTGQNEAIRTLQAAASHDPGNRAMAHSWLITGPPGSGRSNLAYAFAAALLSRGPDDEDATLRQVQARSHPDLAVLATELVIITIDQVRELVKASYYSPSVGRYRVVVVEDADRMSEHSSNVLLKALEEPPVSTVWILCAPSEADLLPTIRSRVRTLGLRVPSIDDVAALLRDRDGVDPETAVVAAREAQSHIGMARRLATDPEARARRRQTLETALSIRSTSDAVIAAATLLAVAGEDAKSFTAEHDEEERKAALRSLGVAEGGTVPPALRAQLRAMEDDQKRRAKRGLHDGLDRILVDLLSLYRDVLLLQLGAAGEPINDSIRPALESAAGASTPATTLKVLDAISTARTRVDRNVSPALVLEAMLIAVSRHAVR